MSPVRLAIGIPSWCERDAIGRLTRLVDSALVRSGWADRTVIINADNHSPDGTREAFLATPTTAAKESYATGEGTRGKGYNFRELFLRSLEHGASMLITIDAELEHVGEDWITGFTGAIRDGHDLAGPVYSRHWYDANMTNQIVAPVFAACTGIPFRQPIGGEFAFSDKAMRYLLDIEWPAAALGFGVDIFCVAELLSASFPYTQQPLGGGKIHSWRSDSSEDVEEEMDHKFNAITGVLLDQVTRKTWPSRESVTAFPNSPPIFRYPKPYAHTHLETLAKVECARYEDLPARHRLLDANSLHRLGADHALWGRALGTLLDRARREGPFDPGLLGALRRLFYIRLGLLMPRLMSENPDEMVLAIARAIQAHILGGGEREPRA